MRQLNLDSFLDRGLESVGLAHQLRAVALQWFFQHAKQMNEFGQNVLPLFFLLDRST